MDTAHDILLTVIEKWKYIKSSTGSVDASVPFPTVVTRSLTLAGVPHRGPEVLEIHALLLKNLLHVSKKDILQDKCITWTEYFQLLTDKELAWHEIVREMLPFMPVTVANLYLEKLLEHAQALLLSGELTTSAFHLCVGGLSLSLGILLDFLVFADNNVNEHIGSREEWSMLTLVSHLQDCLDTLLSFLNRELGLVVCLSCEDTFRATSHSLLLTALLVCPALSAKATCRLLDSYQVRDLQQQTPSEAEEERKTKKRQRQQKGQRKDVLAIEVALMMTRPETYRSENTQGVDVSVCGHPEEGPSLNTATGESFDKSLVDTSCHKVLSELRSARALNIYKKLLSFFCQGSFSDNKKFYQCLQNIASCPEKICIGHHRFSSLVLREEIFPLMRHLTDQGKNMDKPEPCKNPAVLGLFEQMRDHSSDPDAGPSEEMLKHLREQANVFPEELLQPQQSEVSRVLASGRQLGGEADLAMLCTAVKSKEYGWRDLLGRGLANVDFGGWWEDGFFKLFWANEAALASESNVRQVLMALSLAVRSRDAGVCGAEIVMDIRKLLSVMFHRLPPVVQESVVLLHLNDLEPGDLKGVCSLMTEEEVATELTLILNKLTLANADKLIPTLLYLCLFNTTSVVCHVVHAAVTTNGQTKSAVKVLRSMPALCRGRDVHSDLCRLLVCLLGEVCRPDIDEKQAANIVQVLSSVIQPYSLTLGGEAREEMPGILSLEDILQNFIFPNFVAKPDCHPGGTGAATDKHVENGEEEGDGDPTKYNKDYNDENQRPIADEKAEEKHNLESREHGTYSERGGTQQIFPLDIALTTLELLLEKATDKNIACALKFHPLPLVLSLCDCYTQNYTLLVQGGRDGETSISKQRKTRRLASHRCLSLALGLVGSAWSSFSAKEIEWLWQELTHRPWLHTALLAPVLAHQGGYHPMYSAAVDSLCGDVLANFGQSTKRLVYLIQLAVVNDTMSQLVSPKLASLQGSVDSGNLLVALKLVLLTAVPPEMGRLVLIVKCLLTEDKESTQAERSETDDQLPEANEAASESKLWQAGVCNTLTDAVLSLDPGAESERVRCHALSNYQAALQDLVTQVSPSEAPAVLPAVVCQLCTVLAASTGAPAQILQVTAMDVLARLKTALTDLKSRRGARGGARGSSRLRENRALEERLGALSDCISCVHDGQVQKILNTQLQEIAV